MEMLTSDISSLPNSYSSSRMTVKLGHRLRRASVALCSSKWAGWYPRHNPLHQRASCCSSVSLDVLFFDICIPFYSGLLSLLLHTSSSVYIFCDHFVNVIVLQCFVIFESFEKRRHMCFFLCPSYFLYDAESVSELSVSYRLRWNDGPGVLTAALHVGSI